MTALARSADGFSLDGCRSRADVDARREFLRHATAHQRRHTFSDGELRALVVNADRADVAAFSVNEAPEFRVSRVRRRSDTTITRRERRRPRFVAHWFSAPSPFGSELDKVQGAALDATAGGRRAEGGYSYAHTVRVEADMMEPWPDGTRVRVKSVAQESETCGGGTPCSHDLPEGSPPQWVYTVRGFGLLHSWQLSLAR